MTQSSDTLDIRFEAKSIHEDGEIEGLGSVFNNQDKGGDVVLPGAFTKTLEAHSMRNTMPKFLRGHDSDRIIGAWTEMREVPEGLYCKGHIFKEIEDGRETHFLAKKGQLDGLSIGYEVKEAQTDRDFRRHLSALDLWEVSLVTFPMNPEARVTGVKHAQSPGDVERVLRKEFPKEFARLIVANGYTKTIQILESKDRREADSVNEAGAFKSLMDQLQSFEEQLRHGNAER